jgi:Holliday junction resolvasome RuvABC endonuclease subunit
VAQYVITGFDIGTQNTGYGVLIGDTKTKNACIHDFGMIRTNKRTGDIRKRIDLIGDQIEQVLKSVKATHIAIEDYTSQGNRAKQSGKTSQDMSFLVEHIRMLGRMIGYEVDIYPNAYWKKKTLGIGGATKNQVIHYVSWKLPEAKELLKKQPDHVWDSVGIAYCKWLELLALAK